LHFSIILISFIKVDHRLWNTHKTTLHLHSRHPTFNRDDSIKCIRFFGEAPQQFQIKASLPSHFTLHYAKKMETMRATLDIPMIMMAMSMDTELEMILEEPEMDTTSSSTRTRTRESEAQARLFGQNLPISSSYEAIQVLAVWQQEEDNHDVIMSLQSEDDEDDEGLLPLPDQDHEDDQLSSNSNTPPEDLFEHVDAVDTADSFSFLNQLAADAAQADEEANKQQQDSSSTNDPPPPEGMDEAFQESLEKLIQSMKQSQKTRKCLRMKTVKTEKYPRRASVSKVLSSIELSSRQIDSYLQSLQLAVL
jgi:hypothetical protein